MTPLHAEMLFVRSQNTERKTETYTSRRKRMEKRGRTATTPWFPASQAGKEPMVGGATAPGFPATTHYGIEGCKEAAQGRTLEHGFGPEQSCRFMTCNLPASLAGPGVTVSEQRPRQRARLITSQAQVRAVTMVCGAINQLIGDRRQPTRQLMPWGLDFPPPGASTCRQTRRRTLFFHIAHVPNIMRSVHRFQGRKFSHHILKLGAVMPTRWVTASSALIHYPDHRLPAMLNDTIRYSLWITKK